MSIPSPTPNPSRRHLQPCPTPPIIFPPLAAATNSTMYALYSPCKNNFKGETAIAQGLELLKIYELEVNSLRSSLDTDDNSQLSNDLDKCIEDRGGEIGKVLNPSVVKHVKYIKVRNLLLQLIQFYVEHGFPLTSTEFSSNEDTSYEWEASSDEDEASSDGDEASSDGDEASLDGDEASSDGEEASLDGEEPSLDGEEASSDGKDASIELPTRVHEGILLLWGFRRELRRLQNITSEDEDQRICFALNNIRNDRYVYVVFDGYGDICQALTKGKKFSRVKELLLELIRYFDDNGMRLIGENKVTWVEDEPQVDVDELAAEPIGEIKAAVEANVPLVAVEDTEEVVESFVVAASSSTEIFPSEVEFDMSDENSETNDVASSGNIALFNDCGYKVKDVYASLLAQIFETYGDIGENCKSKTMRFRSKLLERVCESIKTLQGLTFKGVLSKDLAEEMELMLLDIDNVEKFGFKLEWLRKRVEDILDACESICKYILVIEPKKNNEQESEEISREIEERKKKLEMLRIEREKMDLIEADSKNKLKKFTSMASLVDGLFIRAN